MFGVGVILGFWILGFRIVGLILGFWFLVVGCRILGLRIVGGVWLIGFGCVWEWVRVLVVFGLGLGVWLGLGMVPKSSVPVRVGSLLQSLVWLVVS